jgi:hypothetical protein
MMESLHQFLQMVQSGGGANRSAATIAMQAARQLEPNWTELKAPPHVGRLRSASHRVGGEPGGCPLVWLTFAGLSDCGNLYLGTRYLVRRFQASKGLPS